MPLFPRSPLPLVLCLLCASASAQTKPPAAAPPPAVGSEPGSTTATYGDWTLRCERAEGDGKRACEVGIAVQVQGQRAPVAQIAFGRPPGADLLRMVAVLPVNIRFPSAVKVAASDKDPQPIELAWSRCLPVGCFAELASSGDAVRRLRAEAGPARLSFVDAAGRNIGLPISLRGLPQALDALAKP